MEWAAFAREPAAGERTPALGRAHWLTSSAWADASP